MLTLLKRLTSKKDEEGFSLVEMVTAIMVLAILSLMAYPFFIKSIEYMSMNNLTTAATIKVQETIEDIRATPTCVKVDSVITSPTLHRDERGIEYRVKIDAPNGCAPGEALLLEFDVTKESDSKRILRQDIQILIPPLNGKFDLD